MIPLGFANAGILAALVLLPAIWYFLRLTPPRPRLEDFPPTRLLFRILPKEEQPSRSPWWLTLMRLTLAAAVIFALAGPIFRPVAEEAPGTGPLLIVIDNGWSSAPQWDDMAATAERIIDLAADGGRPVALLATAEQANQTIDPTDAATLRQRLDALEPRPWSPLYAPLERRLATLPENGFGGAVWLNDGLESDDAASFADQIGRINSGPLTLFRNSASDIAALKPPTSSADALSVPVTRADSTGPRNGIVRARDIRGRVIGETDYAITDGETQGMAEFALPAELRNDIVRLELGDGESAGGVQLIDDRWQRRRIGLITGASVEAAQPLLSPLYYISRAVQPFADISEPREANAALAITSLIEAGSSLIAMADIGTLPPTTEDAVAEWVRNGGTLVRFAGPRLAGEADILIPVNLRQGDRTLGGSLSWQTPQPLAAFADTSPFAGMPVPDDVQVSRQVLAEPDGALSERTWAALADGTPLVTAAPLGRGSIILFHVTADTSWSNLPLSGTFVEMLRRIIAFSSNVVAGDGVAGSQPLPPFRTLDGYGRSTSPGPEVRPLIPGTRASPGAETPPGLYGSEEGFQALNLLDANDDLVPFDPGLVPDGDVRPYPTEAPVDLTPWVLLAAMMLLLADTAAVLWLNSGLRGFVRRRRMAAGTVSVLLAAAVLTIASETSADEVADRLALEAANSTRLAYVVTGDPDIDARSRAGLDGLSRVLAERTALEPGAPIGVDPARDDMAFFPLLYWPVSATVPLPAADTMARVGAFMRLGGSVLFDTVDQLERSTSPSLSGGTANLARLQDMLSGLDIPPLEPVPADHVLTKAFYLLNDFPGRYAGGALWVEALDAAQRTNRPARAGDGVSTILITSNDLASAWAVDESGSFLYPTVPHDRVQREMALRAGVNIVMYTLTGNYKADQVHVPALLERLGQ